MTKKRKKILIISAVAFMVMIAIAVTAVFAYNVVVDYNYDQKAYAASLNASFNGSTVYVDKVQGPTVAMVATRADIILISEYETLELAGQTAAHTAEFVHSDSNTYYRQVFTDLQLDDAAISTSFSASEPISAVLYAAVARAKYTDNTDIKEVVYENRYVSSLTQLMALNFQSNYNNIFELAGNYYGKMVYARTVYILSDITLTQDYTINHPCSINLLDSVITLDANLTLYHSYAGQYFVRTASAGEFLSGTFMGTGNFTVKTPKAYYNISADIKSKLGARLVEVYDFDSYGDLIFEDALDFAASLLPRFLFSDVVLQPSYQTFGINFEYYIVDQQVTPFTGGVSDASTPREGSIKRTAATQTHTIRIFAVRDGDRQSRDVTVSVVGSSAQSVLDYLSDSFATAFLSEQGKIFSAVNLQNMVLEAYTAGGFSGDITVSIAESNPINITDENSAKLLLGGAIASQHTVNDAVLQGTSFLFKRGTVNLSDSLVVTFAGGGAQSVRTFDLAVSTKSEVMYYLKSSSPAFVTNAAYGVLNIASDGTGLYLGDSLLTSSTLGLKSIAYGLISVTESVIIDENTLDYFEILEDGRVLSLSPDALDFPEEFYLQYTCTFDDDTEMTFELEIIKSLADDGGGNQQFESANPFDQLFMNTETNWLEGGTFDVPSTAIFHFARIEILTIDGVVYDPFSPYNMCYIENDTEKQMYTSLQPPYYDFYKSISFVTDLNFVPDRNSVVKVRCTYFISISESVVLVQEYSITIHGVFKCENGAQPQGATPYIFADPDFYDMTITLFTQHYGDNASTYVSTLSDGKQILLSDSTYAKLSLDYSTLAYSGSGVDTKGIHRLINVPTIRLDGIRIADMSSFRLMVGSALKTLSLSGCKLEDSGLYAGGATQSYLYEIQLDEMNLDGNSLTRTDNLLSRTVTQLNLSGQRDGSNQGCLLDIAGLSSIKNLAILDVSDNAIYRFEVLKEFSQLKTVYLYDNRLTAGTATFGTDGLINIPHFVWMIKTNNTRIYARTSDYVRFGPNENPLSQGGNITALMQEGSIALNSFASTTNLFDADGKRQMEEDLKRLKVQINLNGSEGGIDQNVTTDYWFKFVDPETSLPSEDFVLMKNYQIVTNLNVSGGYERCSYIVTIVKEVTVGQSTEEIMIAQREFLIDVYYDYHYQD